MTEKDAIAKRLKDEVAKRVNYNRVENEKVFQQSMRGMSYEKRVEFQTHLLDGMFSVIEAVDFATICDSIVRRMKREKEGTIQ